MRLAGLGSVSDTTILQAGSNLQFTVAASSACSGVDAQDVRDTLNNWAGQMIRVNSVEGKFANWIPFYGNEFDVSVTSLGSHTAGSIRSQIRSALNALAQSCAGSVMLKGETISMAPGGTHDPGCQQGYVFRNNACVPQNSGMPWSTTLMILGLAGLAAVAIVKFK